MLTLPLSEPILFHPLKHHLQYIRQFIGYSSVMDFAEIGSTLRTIGSSQLDFYTGKLAPIQIAQEVKAFLGQQVIRTSEAYKAYLAESRNDFRIISLSDKSDWVLRWGLAEGKYVHLHPARYAEHTIRVKATSLKTAIAILIVSKSTGAELNLKSINSIRKEYLDLPPVKDLSAGLASLIALITPVN